MMRKVKVVKYGQQPATSNPGTSNGPNSRQFPYYMPGLGWMTSPTEVSKSVAPVDRDKANVEAEGGETAYVPDQGGLPAHFDINGPRHSQGGVPLNLPPDTFIYSDTRKMKLKGPILDYFGKNNGKAYTPAEIAKQYDINKYRKILQNPDSDNIQRHSAELMIQNYNKKLGALALVQEGKKGFPDGIPVAAIPFLMSYAIEPEMVLPDMPNQQPAMPPQTTQPPMAAYGSTGTWAAPNYYQVGGTYRAQTEPEYGGNWMGKARAKKQVGGEEEQILQVIQMYAQATGQNPDEIISQLKQMPAEQAQQALQQMAQSVQQMQSDQPEMGDMEYAYGGSYIPKAQEGRTFRSYSGINDPSTGYWDRVRRANLFNRPEGPDEVAIDPQFTKAIEKITPFYGEPANGFLDWAGELFMAPQKEINHLLTGYYETPGTTLQRYYPNLDEDYKFLIDIGTDPLIVGDLAGKAIYKGLEKVAPPVISGAKYVGKQAAKHAKYIGKKLAPLIEKIDPGTVAKYSSKLGQIAAHRGSYGEKPDQGLVSQPPVVVPSTTRVTPSAIPPQPIQEVPRFTQEQQDSLLKALGVKQFGGYIPMAQYGYTNRSAQNIQIPLRPAENLYPPNSIIQENGRYFATNANGAKAGEVDKATYDTFNKGKAKTQTAKPQAKSAAKTTSKGTKSYDPSKVPSDIQQVLDKAGIVVDDEVLKTGKINYQSIDPTTGEYRDVESKVSVTPEAWEKNNQWYLENRKSRGLGKFDPKNKTDVADFEEVYNKKTFDDVYNELVKRGVSGDEAKRAADYFVQNIGFIDDQSSINAKDQKHGNFHKSRIPLKFKEREKAAVKEPEKAKPIQAGPAAQYVAQSSYAPWWLQDLVNIYGTTGDFLRQKKYGPWAPQTEPVVYDPTFYDPTRALAANAEQAAIASQAASTFGAPQQFSARVSGIQGEAAKRAADIMGDYDNRNVAVANTFAGQKAQIYNQANEADARRALDLYDKTTIANQQFDNSRAQARQNMRQAYIAGITNRAQAQAMNTLYPDYQVDPSTGGFLYYQPGVNKMEGVQTGSDNFKDYYDKLQEQFPGVSKDTLFKKASERFESKPSKSSKRGRRPEPPFEGNPYGYPGYPTGAMTYPYIDNNQYT